MAGLKPLPAQAFTVHRAICWLYDEARHLSPTIREIAPLAEMSPTQVHYYVKLLEEIGWVDSIPGRRRTLRPVVRLSRVTDGWFVIPLYGPVAAGQPLAASRVWDDVDVPPDALRDPAKAFALHVHGDSMVDAGLLDGDLVVCHPQSTASDGEMIVARVQHETSGEWEFTVKFVRRQGSRVFLDPANSGYDRIHADHVDLVGVVTGALRWTAPFWVEVALRRQ